jgi:hypothetical protein
VLNSVLRDGVNQAHLRSSISASQSGLAEGPFSYELGSVEMARAGLTNNK